MKLYLYAFALMMAANSAYAMGAPILTNLAPDFPPDYCKPVEGKPLPKICKK